MTSRRYTRLQLVFEKMLGSFEERLVAELDLKELFTEYLARDHPLDIDLRSLAQSLAADIRQHFTSVCIAQKLELKLAELEAASSATGSPAPDLDAICAGPAPEDVVKADRLRRKLDLKAQLEAQLREVQAENRYLTASIQATFDAI